MGYIIGVVSQKGGVGKSTISRAVATTYAAAGWNVKVADLDINQAFCFSWL
ncbi:P-loop NTPase, partial [Actinocorallia longicatena]|uniref:nucleotide-binding protein n=1 Tax=Actinocorallia longicatena TaxID=111803 RepID=UPI0031CE073F